MTGRTAHLQLAIDVNSDPITGILSNGDRRAQPFTGWIELVEAIEQARSAGHVDEAGAPGVEGGAKTLGSLPGAKAEPA